MTRLLCTLFAFIALVLLVVCGREAMTAHDLAQRSHLRLSNISDQGSRLAQIRHGSHSAPPRSTGTLSGKVSAAIAHAGLAASALQSLSPESQTSAAKDLLRERSTLTLANVTLPQLGTFLEAWRNAAPEWTVSSIELSPAGTAPTGSDLPLRVQMTLEGVFKEGGK